MKNGNVRRSQIKNPPPLFPPGRERVVERAFAGGAFFDGDDGAALVDVDQRHVEPRALLQQLQIAGAVGIDIRQADQEEAVGDLDREPRQRRAARLFVGFHQNARHVADAAADEMRRNDIVILNLRSGISMSARTAISAVGLLAALICSVRQITVPTYCLPLGSDGSSSYSTTRCATGAT